MTWRYSNSKYLPSVEYSAELCLAQSDSAQKRRLKYPSEFSIFCNIAYEVKSVKCVCCRILCDLGKKGKSHLHKKWLNEHGGKGHLTSLSLAIGQISWSCSLVAFLTDDALPLRKDFFIFFGWCWPKLITYLKSLLLYKKKNHV